MNKAELVEKIKGKRLAAFDWGAVRVGWAVCDELHIVVSTKGVFMQQSPTFWADILNGIEKEKIELILVGIPIRVDEETTPVIKKIKKFISSLQHRTQLEVIEVDEAFTSKRAKETLIEIGTRRKQRQDKTKLDEVSAAIMLREFLLEVEG